MWSRVAGLVLMGAVGAGVFLPAAGCQTNAATGKSSLMLLSREEEAQLGAEAAPQFTAEFGGKVESAELSSYVNEIGQKMAQHTESYFPTIEWEFTLLNSPVVNAFALPGGKVFFSRGLAEKLNNEAEMAGVLGHEIGHVTAQHGNQRISQQQIFNVGLAIGAVAVGVSDPDSKFHQIGQYGIPALAIGGNVVLLKYGRDQELEADRLGMRYMTKVGYDPKGQLQVMQLLQELSKGSSTPAILSTHPDPAARVQQIENLLGSEYASTQNNKDYQLYPERYQKNFLSVIKKLPPPPAPKQTGMLDLNHPESWCLTCAARADEMRGDDPGLRMASAPASSALPASRVSKAEESRPVAPREGVYGFSAPTAGQ